MEPYALPQPVAADPGADSSGPARLWARHHLLGLDAVVLLIVGLALFWGLGSAPIRDTDEALYAAIALSMAHGGSWLIPHLDGVPYIEKPPLLYWLMALSFKAIGVGAWQARLPDALAAWMTSFGCMVFGRMLAAPVAGRFAALLTGTALGYVLIARTILFDPLMVFFWLIALAMVTLAVQRRQRFWLRAAAVAVALATLTKGPVALLLLGLIAVVQLLFAPGTWKRGALLRFYLDPWAVAIFLLVAAPWHLAAMEAQHGFAWFYFFNETIGRFLGTRIPDDFHHGPWWYYGPKLLIGFFQWAPWVVVLAWFGPRLNDSKSATLSARWGRNAAIVLTLFYSSAGDKGAYYLLPVIPLVAWWLGVKLQQAMEQSDQAAAALPARLGLAAAAFGVAAVALWAATFTPQLHRDLLHSGLPSADTAWLLPMIAGLALTSLAGAVLLRSAKLHMGMAVFALSALVMVQFSVRLAEAKTADLSQKQVAADMLRELPPHTRWFSWQTFEDHDASLLLYGVNHLQIVDSTSKDLWFGCQQARQSTCVTPQVLLQARDKGLPVAVWVARDRLPGWLRSGLSKGLSSKAFKNSVVYYSRGD